MQLCKDIVDAVYHFTNLLQISVINYVTNNWHIHMFSYTNISRLSSNAHVIFWQAWYFFPFLLSIFSQVPTTNSHERVNDHCYIGFILDQDYTPSVGS